MLIVLGRPEGLPLFCQERRMAMSAAVKNDFSQGKMWRNILSQAIPLTIAQAVQVLYNVVDRI